MQNLNIEYNNKYIPDWDKTVLFINIADDDGNVREHITYVHGKLSADDAFKYFNIMYNRCIGSEPVN